MEVEATSADRNLLLEMKGELDHHGARNALRELELSIDAALPKKLADPAGPAADAAAGREPAGAERASAGTAGPGCRRHRPAGDDTIKGGVHTMKTKANNEVTLAFPSRSSNEGFARAAVSCFAAQMDPTLNELEDIKTAVSEAVTNAIVHAYPDSIGQVVVKVRICPDQVLEVTVRDHGRGIPDIEKARQPMFTTGGEERSGMGFTIMESFMDRLVVRSTPSRGTTVVMRKRLAPRMQGTK